MRSLRKRRADTKRRAGRGLPFLVAAALVVSPPTHSAQGGRDERPEVDPYTKNDPEVLRALGYDSLGPFLFGEGHTSETVTTSLGNVPLLWIETPHFRIGCSLDSYRLEDKDEKKKLRGELERLARTLPRVKPKTRSLDPWLRAHLFAQRLEELHAKFCATLGVLASDADPEEGKARVATRGPTSVLLVEKRSTLSRYTQEFCKTHREDTHTEYFVGTGTFVYGIADDSVEADDTALHFAVSFGVAQVLGYSIHGFPTTPPRWWVEGLGRYFARLVDDKCQLYASTAGEALPSEELADWETLVLGRVKAEFYPSWEKTLAWTDGSQMKFADHILLWSRMDWLLDQNEKVKASLIEAFHAPAPYGTDLEARHAGALEEATGMDLDGLDAAWRAWVEENYSKKGRKKRKR